MNNIPNKPGIYLVTVDNKCYVGKTFKLYKTSTKYSHFEVLEVIEDKHPIDELNDILDNLINTKYNQYPQITKPINSQSVDESPNSNYITLYEFKHRTQPLYRSSIYKEQTAEWELISTKQIEI